METSVHRVVIVTPSCSGTPLAQSDAELQAMTGTLGAVCRLDVALADGGPWAGLRDMISDVLRWARTSAPDLIDRHSLELAYVIPSCRRSIIVHNPNLTDTAPAEEKTRNYAADRAFRIVHGLVDLVAAWRERTGTTKSLIIVCNGFDDAGALNARFFAEVMRRKAESHNLYLVISSHDAAATTALFPPSLRPRVIVLAAADGITPPRAQQLSPEEAETLATSLEEEVGIDRLEQIQYLPELIRWWNKAGDPVRELRWRIWAVDVYNNLGLYEDSLTYGGGLIADIYRHIPDEVELLWKTCMKMTMNYIGLGKRDEALDIVQKDASFVRDRYPFWEAQLDYVEAILCARYSEPRDLTRGEALLNAGLVKLTKARLGKAEESFQRVFNRNGVAMIRSFEKRFHDAISLCEEGIATLEADLPKESHKLHRSVLFYNMAQVYANSDHVDEALTSYGRAIEMDPNYSEYYNERASLYLKVGNLEAALSDYRRAIELSPPYHEVFTNIGQCYRAMGRSEDAIIAYTKSIDLEPAQPLALIARGSAQEQLQNSENAIADYSAAIALDSELWDGFASRGVLLYEGKQFDKALADFNRAIELSPNNVDLLNNRCLLLIELGDIRGGRRDFEHMLELGICAEDERSLAAILNGYPENISN